KDAATLERVVIYQALYGDYETYVRPYDEFVSEVDYEKYPEVTAKYRFTPVGRRGDGTRAEARPVEIPAEPKTDNRKESAADGASKVRNLNNEATVPHRRSAISGIDPHTGVSRRMLAFLDTDSMDEKYELLTDMMVEGELSDQIIDNLAASMDVVVPEGKLDDRYDQLRICIRTRAKYELQRLR
ncbi:MAG: DUF1653 domain-containing protein, partial [Lachnospiraceae bacterium]|nr:DUF1653 domain-containing protein [Lachnospiraceae bacterium]